MGRGRGWAAQAPGACGRVSIGGVRRVWAGQAGLGGDLLAGSAAHQGIGRPGVLVVTRPPGRIRGQHKPVT